MVSLAPLQRRCVAVAALCFCAGSSFAAILPVEEEIVPPIKIAPGAKLQKDAVAMHHAWAERVLVAPLTAGLKDEPWKKEAIAFLEKAVDDLGYAIESKDRRSLAEQGQKVLDQGCQEPLLRYLTARLAYHRFLDDTATAKVLDEVAKQITTEHRYGAALLCFIGKDAFRVRRSMGLSVRGAEKGMNDLLKKALGDGSYGKDDDVLFVLHQLESQWLAMPQAQPAAFLECFSNPAIPEWARHTLRGNCEVDLAWAARGGGWASSVTENGWAGFGEHLGKAGAELTEAWKERPDQPFAAERMISVALGGAAKESNAERLWFDRTIAAQFDFYPAYHALLWAYRPRWGGSHALMIAFGRECRKTGRFDTFVPRVLRDAVNDVLDELPDRRTYLQAHPDLTRELMALDRELMQHPGPTGPAEDWRTKLAIDAWCIGDYSAAREALAQLKDGLNLAPVTLRELRASSREIVADVALAGTEAGAARDTAESAYEKGDLDTARAGLLKAASLAKGEAAAWLRSRVEVVDFERAFGKGDWVKVNGETGGGWLTLQGNYRTEPDGTLVHLGDDAQGLIIYRGRVGPNFEVRGHFEIQSPSHRSQNFEVALGWDAAHALDWMECSLSQNTGEIVSGALHAHYGFDGVDLRKVVTLEDRNQFYVRSQGGRVTFELNDRPLVQDFTPPQGRADLPDGHFGFSSSNWGIGNTTRISDIEVRRLPAK